MIRISISAILLLAGLGASKAAAAQQTASATFDVTANVVKTCRIEAGNTLGFGAYDPTSATATTGTTTIRVRCTNGTSAPIALNGGANGSGAGCTTRAMASGAQRLSYELYRDDARTQPWGCTDGTNTRTYTATNAAFSTLTVWGSIPAGQNALVGNYTDTVTATVTF